MGPTDRPSAAITVGIVIITRDRCNGLLDTLDRLAETQQSPVRQVPVVVVDNGSSDATVAEVNRRHPWCQVLELGENRGSAGRTDGALVLDTDLVAFADDDSWWTLDDLERACDLFARHPRMGLLAARVLVGPQDAEDPVCAAMARSPFRPPPGVDLPGPAVLGFVACGAVARREAYLAVGGFHPRYGVGGEESLLALDLAAARWGCSYVADVVAHHHPSPSRDPGRRRSVMVRNDIWTLLLRRPLDVLAEHTDRVVDVAARDPDVARGLDEALAGAAELWAERRPLPLWLEQQLGPEDLAAGPAQAAPPDPGRWRGEGPSVSPAPLAALERVRTERVAPSRQR